MKKAGPARPGMVKKAMNTLGKRAPVAPKRNPGNRRVMKGMGK
jgi:hypothetical protein